jgi:hypothetical protein
MASGTAEEASSRSCENDRLSAGTERPPLLAISRCRSIFMEAKPRFEVDRSHRRGLTRLRR